MLGVWFGCFLFVCLSYKEKNNHQLKQMILKHTAESLLKAGFTNISSQPKRTTWGKKAVSAGCHEGRESQSANYRKLLCGLSPTACCSGSVASFMIRPVNQLCSRTLLCKLKYLIPTVLCQRGWFLFSFFIAFCCIVFFPESNSWSQK